MSSLGSAGHFLFPADQPIIEAVQSLHPILQYVIMSDIGNQQDQERNRQQKTRHGLQFKTEHHSQHRQHRKGHRHNQMDQPLMLKKRNLYQIFL